MKHPFFPVLLSGTKYFEGFLLQARDAANQGSASTVGTFTLTNPNRTQLLTCNKHQVYIRTHAHRDTKSVVVMTCWEVAHSDKIIKENIKYMKGVCVCVQGSAVSHTSDARQTEVVVIWNAPADAPSQVQFL